MNDLESLMAYIAKNWNCNPERYPELLGMTAEQRRNFLVKHSVLHITKTNGKIAAICENFDHEHKNLEEDGKNLQVAAVKMFINALKLAEESGLSASDLLTRAPEYIK